MNIRFCFLLFCLMVLVHTGVAQQRGINWTPDGLGFYSFKGGAIVRTDPKTDSITTVIGKELLSPSGSNAPLRVQSFDYSNDKNKVLLFANTAKVWRYNTRGDYWVLNTATGNQLKQLGKGLPSQSLMFAKFSPDSRFVAYISEHNLYMEDVSSGQIR